MSEERYEIHSAKGTVGTVCRLDLLPTMHKVVIDRLEEEAEVKTALLAELKAMIAWGEGAVRAGCVDEDGRPDDEMAAHAIANHHRLQAARDAILKAEGGAS